MAKLSNRDLLVVSVLSGIGGVMSTYVGYLGNLLNRIFGVPFGAGQFVAGLHVFWIIIAAGLVKRTGAATAAGLLKGTVEFLTGSTHGIVIILISLCQGLLVDITLFVLRKHNLTTYLIAGGVAAASNVFVFQLLYFSGVPLTYLLLISSLALISGILLAGCFGKGVLDLISQVRPTRIQTTAAEPDSLPLRQNRFRNIGINFLLTGILVLALSGGAIYYFSAVYEPPWLSPQLRVEGEVANPTAFKLSHFDKFMTTINSELKGQVTHIPAQDYTGIPVAVILKETAPKEGASELEVIASDGYKVTFPLEDVIRDDKMIIIEEDDTLRLVAGNYEGGYWVKQVNRFVVK